MNNYNYLLESKINDIISDSELINEWFLKNEYSMEDGTPITMKKLKPHILKYYEDECQKCESDIVDFPYGFSKFSFFCNKTFVFYFKYKKSTGVKSIEISFIPLNILYL